ncbi:MAG: MoaD/ThiS family protein [Candidatus Obscuribacterales bacterium]|nr:MoaD/ThiS family protein [Candidatus Obscuribacterales bacterium]
MLVLIPSPLRSYTGNLCEVEECGSTLAELLDNLDRRFPGIRFRMIDEQDAIRKHIRIYVDKELSPSIGLKLAGNERIQIVCALSGG